MSTLYVGPGGSVDYTAGSAISSNDVVVMGVASTTDGSTVGVAMTDIANGSVGAVAIEGVFNLPKVTGAVIAQGSVVNWDDSASAVEDHLSTAASGDVEGFGIAMEAAGSGVLTIKVKLMPGLGLLKA